MLGEFMAQDRSTTVPYGQRLRIERKVRSQSGWTNVEIAWDTAGLPLFDLAEALEKLRVGLTELDQTGVPGLDDLVTDFSSLTGQFSEAYLKIHAAIVDPQENDIYWAEADANERRLSIHVAPLHVGPLVEQHLFMEKDNVILTSATLRTAGSYSYIQERLHTREARTATVGSPFDYKSSTLIFVPTDMSLPDAPDSRTGRGSDPRVERRVGWSDVGSLYLVQPSAADGRGYLAGAVCGGHHGLPAGKRRQPAPAP